MPKFQPPRGTRDFMPEDMSRRQYVLDTFRRVFESFGFRPMDTPAFESWELLSKKGGGGEGIKDEIYYFKDKSDRELGLRFDLTVPLARVAAGNPQLQLPFKRYQISKVWRYDRPQAGRMREFVQADSDIVGTAGMEADAECIAVAVEALRALGFRKLEVRLNNRKILNALVESVNIPGKKAPEVFRILDKTGKAPRSEIIGELKRSGIDAGRVTKLMKLIDVSGAPEKTLPRIGRMLAGIGTAEDGTRGLEQIVTIAKSYGIDKCIKIDLSLVRGLEYYTGPIFEVSAKAKRQVGSVAGGGRYDNLIEMYGGKPTPATGISFGIERIFEVMCAENMFAEVKPKTSVFVVSVNDDAAVRGESIVIAQKLRSSGVDAETDLMGRDLRKQLDYANRRQIPFVLIVGPDEMKTGRFTMKEMKTGREKKAGLENLVKKLKDETGITS
ncbi:MAG: histidine--tRNA ligase [Candidatus Aenigmarchaeota archaeon]|nr:histidine--tRNA ligase [Candidatus Aenigmarchaeota archaeon]